MNYLPSFARMHQVFSFNELILARMENGVNAVCWARALEGDFDEIVRKFGPVDEITSVDEEDLLSLSLTEAGRMARKVLLQDLRALREAGLDPNLDLIPAYPRDDDGGPVPTDVYSYHADRAPIIADTWLCSYTVSSSEGLANEQAIRRVDVPETRAELLRIYGGQDDEAFAVWLNEHCYDLHYVPLPGAKPFIFGLGNFWRIANECPGSPVPPCVHRAPATVQGQPPRLLLIS